MTRVLITRPQPDASAFAAMARARGLHTVVAPLMEIEFIDAQGLDGALEEAGALAFTSANGVRAFAAASPMRALPVFAVGPASAKAAREAGFLHVEAAGGDVLSLAALIAARRGAFAGDVLHIAGSDRAGDLVAELGKAGLSPRRIVLYRARAAAQLPPPAVEALKSFGSGDWAAFFSPRSAALFAALVEEAGLGSSLSGLRAACLSEAVADAVSTFAWGGVSIAPRRDAHAMLDLMASLER